MTPKTTTSNSTQPRLFSKGESYIDPSGFYIINDLLGIVSILTSNIVSLFNAFTWFTIALNCDFTVSNESKLHTEE